jgi:tetratricopeptide (TPR) repeat protein
MIGAWLRRVLGLQPGARTVTLRERGAAMRLPVQTPLNVTGRPRSADSRCEECAAPLVEVLLTTGGPGSDPELWREHPVAIDGWLCRSCSQLVVPRFLEPDEAAALLQEGAGHAEAGRVDEAEIAFRRVCNSWPRYAPARLNLATLYGRRVRAEHLGEGRPLRLDRYLNVMEAQLKDALRGEHLPDVAYAVGLLADALLQRGAEGAAAEAVEQALRREGTTDHDRDRLQQLAEWVRRRGDLYERGTAAVDPHMIIDGRDRAPLDAGARRRLEHGVADLVRYQRLNPGSWQALWIAGKGRQALADHAGATELLGRAFELKGDQPDVAREYALELIALGRLAEAERVAHAACGSAPADAGLVANLALVLLLAGRPDEAHEAATRALAMSPEDRVTQTLLGRIADVRAGRRPPPTRIQDV